MQAPSAHVLALDRLRLGVGRHLEARRWVGGLHECGKEARHDVQAGRLGAGVAGKEGKPAQGTATGVRKGWQGCARAARLRSASQHPPGASPGCPAGWPRRWRAWCHRPSAPQRRGPTATCRWPAIVQWQQRRAVRRVWARQVDRPAGEAEGQSQRRDAAAGGPAARRRLAPPTTFIGAARAMAARLGGAKAVRRPVAAQGTAPRLAVACWKRAPRRPSPSISHALRHSSRPAAAGLRPS